MHFLNQSNLSQAVQCTVRSGALPSFFKFPRKKKKKDEHEYRTLILRFLRPCLKTWKDISLEAMWKIGFPSSPIFHVILFFYFGIFPRSSSHAFESLLVMCVNPLACVLGRDAVCAGEWELVRFVEMWECRNTRGAWSCNLCFSCQTYLGLLNIFPLVGYHLACPHVAAAFESGFSP